MKKFQFLLFLIITFIIAQVNAQQKNFNSQSTQSIGNVSVKTWFGNKKAAYTFSFDDSFKSQYDFVLPIMNQFGFKATFYAISGYVTDNLPGIWRYGTWPEFRQMAAEGHEIGAHTMTHPDLTTLPVGDENTPKTITYELAQSKKIIEQEIPGQKCITAAYPYCAENATVEQVASKYFEAVRGCGNGPNPPDISGNTWYNVSSSDIPFSTPRNSTSDDLDELTNYENKIQTKGIDQGRWAIMLAHEVFPFDSLKDVPGSYYPISTEWLTAFCEWVKQKSDNGDLWVETLGNVTRYVKERENFFYQVKSNSSNQIVLSTGDNLDNSIYNFPLTIDVVVPSTWQSVSVNQVGNIQTSDTFVNNGITYARMNIIPDGGDVTINGKGNAEYAVSGSVLYNNSSKSPLANVTVLLSDGNTSLTTTTDINGNYNFPTVAAGNYTITASKSDEWNGVNSIDALKIAKYFIGNETLDTLQKFAADVNNDNNINSLDALMIAKRFVGLTNSFDKPDWVFQNPISITVGNSNVTQNILGMATGDVDESYTNPNSPVQTNNFTLAK